MSVAGGGISNDANHISAPSRTGDGLWYAIRAALAEAGTGAREVGLVNTHGTATAYNDEMESKALHLAGLCGVPCNSLKPYFGHTLGASGVIESIVTVRELCEGTCFGVKGYAECGVPYPPDLSAAHRKIQTDTALKTASGFGGCNAAVVFRRAAGPNAAPGNETTAGQGSEPDTGTQGGNDCPEAARARSGTAMSANDRGHGKNAVGDRNPDTGEKAGGHAETGTGRHGSGIRCHDTAHVVIAQHPSLPFDAFIRERYRALADPNMKFSKMDDLCKLAYVASCELLSGHRPDCPAERIGVVMANRSASLDSDRRHQAIIDAGDGCGVSPAVFVYTLPNIMLGQVAIKHGLKGESTFFAFPDKSSNFIREYAASLIAEGRMDAVLWGWCEFDGGSYDCELTLTEKTGQDTMEDLELQLKQQIIEALNLEEITADEIATDAPLFGDGLGLDSIDALEITLLLEKHYGIRLANPAEAKPIFYSVATLADYIRKNRPQ